MAELNLAPPDISVLRYPCALDPQILGFEVRGRPIRYHTHFGPSIPHGLLAFKSVPVTQQ